MCRVARGFILLAVLLTVCTARQLAREAGFSVRSLQRHGHHFCNAIHIARDVFLTPAACLSVSDPVGLELLSTEVSPKMTHTSSCNVRKYQSHPKYAFLSHNIGLVRVQCEQNLSVEPSCPILESATGDRLTLVGVSESLQKVYSRVKVQECFVCKKEYGAFDCERQMCLKPSAKLFGKLQTVEGLVGAGIFTQNATLAGVLSYGFANRSLVAERVIYYKQFLHRTMQEFQVQ